jgi:hypothetical protein
VPVKNIFFEVIGKVAREKMKIFWWKWKFDGMLGGISAKTRKFTTINT